MSRVEDLTRMALSLESSELNVKDVIDALIQAVRAEAEDRVWGMVERVLDGVESGVLGREGYSNMGTPEEDQ